MNIALNYPWPNKDTNKHKRGRLAVFSGDELSTGAARLSARAGAKIGAGWVVLFTQNIESARIIASHETEIMVKLYNDISQLDGFNSIVFGPAIGINPQNANILYELLNLKIPMVIDADGISIIAKEKARFFAKLSENIILTPHSGEFYRLFDYGQTEVLDLKLEHTLKAAIDADCIILHKGKETIIAHPNGEYKIFDQGTPWLATMGTGDVLSGLIGGLIAMGLDTYKAACLANQIHTECAIKYGAGLVASNLFETLPIVLNRYAPENLKSQ